MRTLLLADDNITVQRVITLTFADQPIRVVTCGDGQQATEQMAAQRPDIVLAGTSLPTVNGYDLARFIRNQPGLKEVPVLLLSGAFEDLDEARVVSSGASGIIEKPVEPNNVIGRVKELLGLKSDEKPAAAGRLITSAEGPARSKPPTAAPSPIAVTPTRTVPPSWEQTREQTGIDAKAPSVDDASPKPADYLETLNAAFDTLDQQLSGGAANAKPSRNPSGPLGQARGAPDPRSPGREPRNTPATSETGNPVFEVDDEWFGGDESAALAYARAGRREIQEDLRDPELQAPAADAPANAVFEVDEDWFAEDNKNRAAKLEEQRALAAEMGIHEVELPQADPAPNDAAPMSDLDFDFGLDDMKRLQETAPPAVVDELPRVDAGVPELIAELSPPTLETAAPIQPAVEEPDAHLAVLAPSALPVPYAPDSPSDNFSRLLAFEQGEHHELPQPPAPEVRVVAPEVTEQMLDQIATRVAERLYAGPLGEQIKDAMTAMVRDVTRVVAYEAAERIVREVAAEASERVVRQVAAETAERVVREVAVEASERVAREVSIEASARIVRDVVSETSERLVRDEIDRIRSKHQ